MLARPGMTCNGACSEWNQLYLDQPGPETTTTPQQNSRRLTPEQNRTHPLRRLTPGMCDQNRMDTIGASTTLFDEVTSLVGCEVFADSQDYAPSFWPYSSAGCYCSRRAQNMNFPDSCDAHSPMSDRRWCCCNPLTGWVHATDPAGTSGADNECPDPIPGAWAHECPEEQFPSLAPTPQPATTTTQASRRLSSDCSTVDLWQTVYDPTWDFGMVGQDPRTMEYKPPVCPTTTSPLTFQVTTTMSPCESPEYQAQPATGNWLLGEAGESCDETCGRSGDVCNFCGMQATTEAMAQPGSGMLSDLHRSMGCDDLRLPYSCNDPNETLHPSKDIDRCCWDGHASQCETKRGSVRRLCCCGIGMCSTSEKDVKDRCEAPCKVESDGSCNCQADVGTSGGYTVVVAMPVALVVAALGFASH